MISMDLENDTNFFIAVKYFDIILIVISKLKYTKIIVLGGYLPNNLSFLIYSIIYNIIQPLFYFFVCFLSVIVRSTGFFVHGTSFVNIFFGLPSQFISKHQ